MKPKTFFSISLFLPYVAWIIIFLLPVKNPVTDQDGASNYIIINILSFVFSIFESSIWVWGIPYTLLVFGMLIWSKKQSTQRLYSVALVAPFFLSKLTSIEVAILLIVIQIVVMNSEVPPYGSSLVDPFFLIPIFSGLTTLVILPYGYIFVSIGMLIYKGLSKFNLIHADAEISIQPVTSEVSIPKDDS